MIDVWERDLNCQCEWCFEKKHLFTQVNLCNRITGLINTDAIFIHCHFCHLCFKKNILQKNAGRSSYSVFLFIANNLKKETFTFAITMCSYVSRSFPALIITLSMKNNAGLHFYSLGIWGFFISAVCSGFFPVWCCFLMNHLFWSFFLSASFSLPKTLILWVT